MVGNPPGWQTYAPTRTVTTRVVAPTAGQVIADLGAFYPGIYRVTAMASYGGTADVIDNMALFIADTKVTDLPVIPVANSTPIVLDLPAVRLLTNQAVQIRATAAGGVGTVFRGTLIVTPVQSQDPS